MNWTGKPSVFFAVLALVLTGLFAVPAHAEPLNGRSGEESGFFYPSFPLEGGPHIIGASFWDGAVSDTTGDLDSLIIAFNEPIDVGTLDLEDFLFEGFTLTGGAMRLDDVTGKMVVLSGTFAGVQTAGQDSIALAWESIAGTDASVSKEIGYVPITSGPLMLDVTLEPDYVATGGPVQPDPDNMELTIIFDHPMDVDDVTSIFKNTPELSDPAAILDIVRGGRYIHVTLDAGTGLRAIHQGISKLWLDAGEVFWTAFTDTDGLNALDQKVAVNNEGPVLLAAYYTNLGGGGYDANDEVWLIFDEPIPTGSLDNPDQQYVVNTINFGGDATQDRQPASAQYANVLVVRNPGFELADGDSIKVDTGGGDPHFDYQGLEGPSRWAWVEYGVGITRAAYFDRGTDLPIDDELHLWFSQELDEADVTALDFVIFPEIADFWNEVTIQVENINGLGHIVVNGIDQVVALNNEPLPDGFYVRMATDDAFDGLEMAGAGCDSVSLIPIFNDSKPLRINLAEVSSLTYKRYNSTTFADTAFLAWRETGLVDDSDDYFLFFTNQTGTPLDQQFIENYRQNALSLANLMPRTVDDGVQRIAVDIEQGQPTTDGHAIVHGDQLRFMLVPGTYWGEMADGDKDGVLKFDSPIFAGPVCPPVDFDAEDDDIIHVTGTYDPVGETWNREIFGDANACPCGSRVYIFDGDTPDPDPLSGSNLLGWGTVNANGSFDPVALSDEEGAGIDVNEIDPLYVYAWEDGAYSDPLEILNDLVVPGLLLSSPIADADRFNPFQIYKADDYINILTQGIDWVGDPGSPDAALSDLLEVAADFTEIDNRTTIAAALGGFGVDSIPFASLGNDEIDNDGDWVAHDALIDLNDDGVMDFPEPYFDEDGSGSYDLGETFIDKDGDDLYDGPGGTGTDFDLNLDSADPDEHSWYEIRLLAAGDEDLYNDVVKGFQILDPVTDPNGLENFGEIQDLPVFMTVHDAYLDQTTAYDDEADPPFSCELDEVAPTVSKITEFYTMANMAAVPVPADNVILPTDPTYHMGRYLDLKVETPSDDDVLFGVMQLREAGGTWAQLTMDPIGWNVDAGIPGVAEYDDDGDADALVDADEDGVLDNEGDGIDLLDAEVVDALQDSAADANATAPDGLYLVTDRRDNDNDAFFIFEPYYDPAVGDVHQKIVWFNIDERNDNDIDDDFSGVPDDGETESYVAQSDDNEDGIIDGEAVELTADGVRIICAFDSTYADVFYVDAAHVLGAHPADHDGDIRALTEFIDPGYGVMDANGEVLTDGTLPGLPWGDDAVAAEFAWHGAAGTIHPENLDWWHIAQLFYGEIPDGTQEYDLRMVAYDQAGNVNADYSVPVTFTVDVDPPEVSLTDCEIGGLPEDLGDGVICPEGSYTLTVENIADAATVYFQGRTSTDEGVTWSAWGDALDTSDTSIPFTAEWDASAITILDTPPDYYVLVEFRAYGEDEFGNVQDPDSACVAQVRVEDCQAPTTWFTLIHETENPNNTIPDCMATPPTNGSAPNPYYYRDDIGPLQVPKGPAVDVWALFVPHPDSVATCFHDVIRVVFEYRPAGAGAWTMFETVTGHIVGDTLSLDLTLPVAVTLETEALATGSYDLRVYACDIEGNCNVETADLAMITIVDEGLRAYIEPPYREAGGDPFELYAINWIHDTDLDHVDFQFYEDTNANGIDDDSNQWLPVATDDDTSADPRGDVVLYRGSDSIYDMTEGAAEFVAFQVTAENAETFIDYDGDGYSERDPVIFDGNGDGVYDPADDAVVLGDVAEIMTHPSGLLTLTLFADDEFHTGTDLFDPTEWIMKENAASGQPTGTLNLWHVPWDVTGVDEGTYLVRAVATDVLFAVDDSVSSPSVIPTEMVTIDAMPPAAVIAEITPPDGVAQTAVDGLYFNGQTGWLKICAESADLDLENVLIQFRIPGHDSLGAWNDLDVNDDNDFYADIDGEMGLTAEDEIILDDGDFVFNAANDVVLYAGANGEVNTPEDWPLTPLNNVDLPAARDYLVEETDNGTDDDHDGMTDEDLLGGEDRAAPYCVYLHIGALGLISDTNVELRAVATDQSANTDPAPAVLQVILGETVGPETDVVWVRDADGMEIDVFPAISDGDGVTQLEADEMLTIMVTGEDATAIESVDLMWRFAAPCSDLDPWDNPWRSMSDDGATTLNTSYDYPFEVDVQMIVDAFGDGLYEFYPMAVDNNGNATPPPENPYQFGVLTTMAAITTALPATVAPGDEFWFSADVTPANDDATVDFKYAERVLDVMVDATRITPHPEHATYMTLPLATGMAGDPALHAILTVDGEEGTFYADADELIADGDPLMPDWTYDAADKTIEFLTQPGADAVILVSYNVTGWNYLWVDASGHSQDDDAPYTAAWDRDHGGNGWTGVPEPAIAATEAYDIIATVILGARMGDENCELEEMDASEGQLLMLINEDAPDVFFYGMGLRNDDPGDFWPGNPSFDSTAGLIEWKLSGMEHEFFVRTDPVTDIDGVELVFEGPYREETRVAMAEILDDMLPMTFTLYQSDFPEVLYGWENVALRINSLEYAMAETEAGSGIWQVTVPVATGTETTYLFAIDQDGNGWDDEIPDPRNWMDDPEKGGAPLIPGAYSSVKLPSTPFWYAAGPDMGELTAVWQVKAEATDTDGHLGMSDLYTFVYDPVEPTIDELAATSLRFSSDANEEVYATITDPVPADFNVITVTGLLVQYCPNYAAPEAERVWLDYGSDFDPSDGWSVSAGVPDPEFDGYNNDGDDLWDEEDEATSAMAWRAFAMDDGHNYSAPIMLEFTLDDTPPAAELTAPTIGQVFSYGETLTLTAAITVSEEDIHHVLFQYNVGDDWENVDITPEDDDDADFDAVAPYEVMFNTTDYLDEEDVYVRFRAVAVDHAFNEADDPMEVLVVINDITGPTAFPLFAATTLGNQMPLTDPHVAVHGPEATIYGIVLDPSGWENIATVTVQYMAPTRQDWVTIEVVASDQLNRNPGDNDMTAHWHVDWDTHPLPEGDYLIRAVAADIDGNADPEPREATLPVDHTAPEVLYEPIEGFFAGFAPWAYYLDDDIVDHQSKVLTPDRETGDIAFMVVTRSADVMEMGIQYRTDDFELGDWSEFYPGTFDYEPNLTFEYDSETYYVWWLPVDNVVEMALDMGLPSGPMEIRVLASDYAGNTNILHDANNMWAEWTVDVGDPAAFDFNNDLTDDQVESGMPVTMGIVLSDSTTDVVIVRAEYEIAGTGRWTVIDPDPETPEIDPIALTPVNLDEFGTTWTAELTWATPLVYWDTDYTVEITFYDSAWNRGTARQTFTVEDNIKPEFTKIWAIPAEVDFVDDSYVGTNDGVYEVDCEGEGAVHDGLYIEMGGTAGSYDAGTDIAIDYGNAVPIAGGYVLPGYFQSSGQLGTENATWPRYIDEIVLGGELGEDVMVSHEVYVVARTQMADLGLERVEFWIENEAAERWLLGTDECVPAYGQGNFLWQVAWNTLDEDEMGAPIYPDGVYKIIPIAYDLEGNVEEWGRDLSGMALVTVDNTEPQATMDADPFTEGVQETITVERNGVLTLYATTDVAGLQDDTVLFGTKRATDLNQEEVWLPVNPGEGLDASDINPDFTRPYVFDWDLDRMDVPFPLADPVVGVEYHACAMCWDILGNAEMITDAFDDGRYITFKVVDTQAPVATVIKVRRETGDLTWLEMPHEQGVIHARDFHQLIAKILDGDNDVEKVEFMWALPGEAPMLIDAQVAKDPTDPWTWYCESWDLSALRGQTIEVFAVATDDVGNTDFDSETGRPVNGPVFTVFVDYDSPDFTVITPTDGMKECRVGSENQEIYYDLLFSSEATDIDLDEIIWEWKSSLSEDVDTNWVDCGACPHFDASSGHIAALWNVSEIVSGLYDVRLTVADKAGNETQEIVAREVVLDKVEPWGEVTRLVVNGMDYFPTLPIDITLEDVVTVWATAQDREGGLALNTGVEKIIFQAAPAPGECGRVWRDVGFWQAPEETIYEEVVQSVDWNTSGFALGEYLLRLLIVDEECNEFISGSVVVTITDQLPPRARIAGFDPWREPHGDDPTTYLDIFAVGYCDSTITEVQFQYSTDAGETWIPIGISGDIFPDVDMEHSDWGDYQDAMCDLWYATIDLRTFEVGDDVWFRAIATDEEENQDETPPTVKVAVVEHPDGAWDVMPEMGLGELTDLGIKIEGGSDPDDLIIKTSMAGADQRPYVLFIPALPINEGGQPYCVEMQRMIGPSEFELDWQGAAELIWDECGKSTIFAGAMTEALEIDLWSKHVWTWDVDYVLGTNGTAYVPGYVAVDTAATPSYLYATATVPSGSGEPDTDKCLLLMPSDPPVVDPDQARFMTLLPRTNYAVGAIDDCVHEMTEGFPWTVTIEYDDAALQEAAGEDWAAIEPYLTVRAYNWWTGEEGAFTETGWTGENISHVTVDTENNVVTFSVNEFCYMRPFYALFAPKWDAPVAVKSFTPNSPYAGRWNYTDRDPKIVIDLNSTGAEVIDSTRIEVWIDGSLVASAMPEGGAWVQGNGDLLVERKNPDGTMYQVTYWHPTERAWWLMHGDHTLNVMYKIANGVEDWFELPATAPGASFFVDAQAPIVEFHGGWVDNPILQNVSGYLNPLRMEEMLTAYLYDPDAGVLVRPGELAPCDIDLQGIKYDLWLVHFEDDQWEIDEIEERLLLHQGTADEIIPYITPQLFNEQAEYIYSPSDTMVVGLPTVAGGRTHEIQDGDVFEVTLYSKKRIEQLGDVQMGCDAGLVVVWDGHGMPDTLGYIYADCYIDMASRMHIYEKGIMDWAGNAGSEYVEQRFIVDMTPPSVELATPASVEPGEEYTFEVLVSDMGAGFDPDLVTAKLTGPNGEVEEISELRVVGGNRITGSVEGGLGMGTHTLEVTVRDQAGNEVTRVIEIVVESATLTLTETYIYPNPVNPDDMEALIHFNLGRHADVTIKAYDFAGEYVGTVISAHNYAAGEYTVPWAGQASDGTDLANGAYLLRVEAADGSARKTATVKAVIWRE